MQLPKRAFNSPILRYANFKDGSYINLIRLNKPYANGDSFAIYETTKSPFCSSKLFKTYEKALEDFTQMINNNLKETELVSAGITGN